MRSVILQSCKLWGLRRPALYLRTVLYGTVRSPGLEDLLWTIEYSLIRRVEHSHAGFPCRKSISSALAILARPRYSTKEPPGGSGGRRREAEAFAGRAHECHIQGIWPVKVGRCHIDKLAQLRLDPVPLLSGKCTGPALPTLHCCQDSTVLRKVRPLPGDALRHLSPSSKHYPA